MRAAPWVLAVLALICAATSAARRRDDPAETGKFLRDVRSLEADPMQPAAAQLRDDAMYWVYSSVEVVARDCSIAGTVPDRGTSSKAIALMHSALGNAVFQIRHPDQKSDELAIQVAGIKSLLRVYQVIVKADPTRKLARFEQLLEKAEEGRLVQFIAPKVARCVKQLDQESIGETLSYCQTLAGPDMAHDENGDIWYYVNSDRADASRALWTTHGIAAIREHLAMAKGPVDKPCLERLLREALNLDVE